MKTLYNAAGEAKKMDFVDAREHLDTGRWFETAPVIEQSEDEKEKLTAAAIKEKLTASGVEFKNNASKAELQALLYEVTAE